MADSDKGIAHLLRTFFSAVESALSQPAPRWDPSRPGRTLASRLPLGELAVAAILLIVGVGVAVNLASSHRNIHGGPVTSTTPQASSTATPSGASPTPSPTTLVLASPSASPIPRPTGPYYGVLVDRTRSGSAPGNYTIALVASNGMISTTIHPAQPSVVTYLQNWPAPPLVSVASRHVYFLDGDSTVKSLSISGATAVATHVPGGLRILSAFAVSPDESRIAVSVFDYSQGPTPTIRLYVEDLAGGGNHVDLLAPSTPTWPAGWHNGRLVLASGPDQVGSNYPTPNPYNSATGYQVVDPATGSTLATIPKECRYGPLVAAGTGCQADQALAIGGWDGSMRVMPGSQLGGVGKYYWITLAPDGDRIAGYIGPGQISVFSSSTSNPPQPGWGGIPAGWIDENHLVFHPGAAGEVNDLGIWSFEFQSEIPVRLSCGDTACQFAQFMGTLPGSLQ